MADLKIIKAPSFATAFALRPQHFSWFLGAGASATAGIPTGSVMIRDFKTRLFCQEVGLPRREVDCTDPLWVQRIEEFFGRRSLLPPAGDPSEYSAAFEAVFPTESERRQYIEDAIRQGTPSFGHRVLASLITTKRVPCIFTTNFDPLVEITTTQTDQLVSPGERALPTVAALDSAERAERCLRETNWPLIVKLHGDYQSIELKNTTTELKEQDEKLRSVLNSVCHSFGFVFVGYSGRDVSVMDALEKALRTPGAFPSGIYWVARSERNLHSGAREFLIKAVEAGVSAAVVESHNFDELAAEISNHFDVPDPLRKYVFEGRRPPFLRPVALPAGDARKFPVLRCSALLMNRLPPVARRITLSNPASTETVRALIREARVRAVVASTGHEVAAFGHDDNLITTLASLGARLGGTIALKPEVDSWALGLIYDALTRALCRKQPLIPRMRRSGHAVLVSQGDHNQDDQRARERRQRLAKLQGAYDFPLSGTVPMLNYPYNEGVRIRIEQCADRWWCVFDPFTFVEVPKAQAAEEPLGEDQDRPAGSEFIGGDPAGDWRRERWARRYNPAWTRIIDAWAHLLCSSDEGSIRAFGIPEEAGLDAVFGLSDITAWSRPSHQNPYFERRS